MKVTAIETIRLEEFPNLLWVRVETDEGLTGIGDATLNGRELSVVSYLNDHVIPA